MPLQPMEEWVVFLIMGSVLPGHMSRYQYCLSWRSGSHCVVDPSDGVFGRFDLAALCGCHTLKVCCCCCSWVVHWSGFDSARLHDTRLVVSSQAPCLGIRLGWCYGLCSIWSSGDLSDANCLRSHHIVGLCLSLGWCSGHLGWYS